MEKRVTVPPWATTRLCNPPASEACLFRVGDSAVLRLLHIYHEEVPGAAWTK